MRRTNFSGISRYGQAIRSYDNHQKTKRELDFAFPVDHREKLKECEKRDKYLDLARELKKLWNMKVTIVIGALGTVTKGFVKDWRIWNGDHPNYSILEIGQNTEKSPGDLKRFVVTQTPVGNHQLTLAWKTLQRKQIIIIICLRSIIWFQVFLFDTSIFQIDLFES